MNSMKSTEIKNLVESGSYKPDPSRVATAMLRPRTRR
jgi:anti-sigma28 factor (negative regulator of flagellin synthesis)